MEEFDAMMNNLGQAYPSPVASQVSIPVGEFTGAASLEVFDATGRMVMTERVSAHTTLVTLDVEHLNNGLYQARLRTSDGSGAARSFQVVH
ncbi:MAG: T9SS type A sorting domain-containing protein [Flavobacteriales bacterium]|nr:T9SS type A sorting domain-containing protein [Flavobacteriales bacterium]